MFDNLKVDPCWKSSLIVKDKFVYKARHKILLNLLPQRVALEAGRVALEAERVDVLLSVMYFSCFYKLISRTNGDFDVFLVL